MALPPVRHLRTQSLDVIFEEPAWPDLASRDVVERGHARLVALAVLEAGTVGGSPSVAMRIDDVDGDCVVLEMTLATFAAGALAISLRHPELFRGEHAEAFVGRIRATLGDDDRPPPPPPPPRKISKGI